MFFQQPFETATTIPINTTTKNQLKHPKNTQIRVNASQIVTTILTAISTTASTMTTSTTTTTTHSNNNCCFNLRCNHPHLCVSPLRNDDRSSYANCQSTSIQLSKQINIHFLQDLSFFYNCLFVFFARKKMKNAYLLLPKSSTRTCHPLSRSFFPSFSPYFCSLSAF